MQQEQAKLRDRNVQLVVVVEQNATAEQAMAALGRDTDVPLLLGTQSVYNDYRVAGVPANYLIDPRGKLITQVSGWVETLPERWFKLVDEIGGK